MEQLRDLVKQFSNKNIYMEYCIDKSYRPYNDGVPQYRRICKFDGRTVYDDKYGIKEISLSDFQNLQKYAFNIEAYDRTINMYQRYDLTYNFRVL